MRAVGSRGVLGAGLLLGVAGDVLLRAGDAPGLNLSLFITFVAVMTVTVHRRTDGSLSGEAMALLCVGVLTAWGLAWRDSEMLKPLTLMASATAFALPAYRSGVRWVREASVFHYVGALGGAALATIAGAAPALLRVEWGAVSETRNQPRWQRATAVARGAVLATPFVLVFGGLLVSADAVFAGIIGDVVRFDPAAVADHVALGGVLAWLTTGYMSGFTRGNVSTTNALAPISRARLGGLEAAVVLGILNGLFMLFVVIQARYLFGGTSLVEVTPGLTYAEYARRGFFELVGVVALVLPMLLVADYLVRGENPRMLRTVRGLATLQVFLVLAIAASAMQRMRLYQQVYGLTELRVFVTAFLALLAFVMLLFATTVLRGRPRNFAPGSLVAAFLTLATLYGLNPDALIARTNIARLGDSSSTGNFDPHYLGRLSADAVPVLLDNVGDLPEEARCHVSRRLLIRFGEDRRESAWSWSRSRAERLVRARVEQLQSSAERCPDPGAARRG